jgi:hypothetical protein
MYCIFKSGERQGATDHGGAGDVGASDDSIDSQEAPRRLHDNNGVLGLLRNAILGPEIGMMYKKYSWSIGGEKYNGVRII